MLAGAIQTSVKISPQVACLYVARDGIVMGRSHLLLESARLIPVKLSRSCASTINGVT